MKGKTVNTLVIVGVVLVVGYFVLQNPQLLSFNLSGLTGGETNNFYNQSSSSTTTDSRAPSSLTVVVTPNPVTMGNRILGTVTSDGYKYPCSISVKHVGKNQVQSMGGLIDASGRFLHIQTINIPGKWEFSASAGSVKSNTASLTVKGIAVVSSKNTVSRSAGSTADISVYSSYSGNAAVIANDPTHSVSYPLTNCVVNAGGYGVVQVDFNVLAQGTYLIDAVIGGETATSYGGSYSVTVGR
jgi:hypothetical protein